MPFLKQHKNDFSKTNLKSQRFAHPNHRVPIMNDKERAAFDNGLRLLAKLIASAIRRKS